MVECSSEGVSQDSSKRPTVHGQKGAGVMVGTSIATHDSNLPTTTASSSTEDSAPSLAKLTVIEETNAERSNKGTEKITDTVASLSDKLQEVWQEETVLKEQFHCC